MFDGLSILTTLGHNSTRFTVLQIPVPDRYAYVMLSLEDLDVPVMTHCRDDEIVRLTTSGNRRFWESCSQLDGVSLFPISSSFHVEYWYYDFNTDQYPVMQLRRGFRLWFSFHEDATLPQRLSDGAWNCSVPHWPLFRPHVQCNLLTECAGGEDEAPCPYSSARCGPGRLSIGPSCYIYVAPAGPTSWQQASENCRSRGATLAVLKTLEEWTSVARVVLRQSLHRENKLYIGIRTTSKRLHAM